MTQLDSTLPATETLLPETTAERILAAGMDCFAREGFAGATTRMIAAQAGVTLPVIAYHFGNKEGLHRACANAIVEQYRRRLLPLVSSARAAADSDAITREEARHWLETILLALVSAITADAEQRLSTDFVLREMSEQGPGFALLFAELWQPGIALVADLLGMARAQDGSPQPDRIGAVMLLAALSAFTREEAISRPFLGWERIDDARHDEIGAAALRLLRGLTG
ncbi:TetR/AcrR family transcriptional regulator [Novosphingobium sp. FKTRR1]|uniref:TetR/AcrR family transcriptional regulator n=1 Tax=Novosphingobium sp. FKTRR1 TaxID=2879118 RepID=UPI001CF08D03|nr:TetR/AcrR family transcriptional regulator [Novosphingobium sp. FKTRR1]